MKLFQTTFRSVLLFALVLLPQIAIACPTCKDSLHDNGSAMGFAISIIFMMSMPLLITTFWAVLIWRLRSGMMQENVGNSDHLFNAQPTKAPADPCPNPAPTVGR